MFYVVDFLDQSTLLWNKQSRVIPFYAETWENKSSNSIDQFTLSLYENNLLWGKALGMKTKVGLFT